jgi:hypothetical protein
MQRLLSVCALAAAIVLGAAFGPAQAAPVSGLSAVPAEAARSPTIVDKAGWRRWRYVGWHRYWWRRWRRY